MGRGSQRWRARCDSHSSIKLRQRQDNTSEQFTQNKHTLFLVGNNKLVVVTHQSEALSTREKAFSYTYTLVVCLSLVRSKEVLSCGAAVAGPVGSCSRVSLGDNQPLAALLTARLR